MDDPGWSPWPPGRRRRGLGSRFDPAPQPTETGEGLVVRLADRVLADRFSLVRAGLVGAVLVYGHPLMAFAVLDRELKRSRPSWRGGYRLALLAVPCLLVLLIWSLASAPDLMGDDPITSRIARHAGSDLLAGVSSHMLVASHAFLEMLHYGVWLVAIPLASLELCLADFDRADRAEFSAPAHGLADRLGSRAGGSRAALGGFRGRLSDHS